MAEGIIENNEAISMYFEKIRENMREIDENLISTVAEIKRIEKEENSIVAAKLIPAYQVKVDKLQELRKTFSELSEKVYENIVAEEQQYEVNESEKTNDYKAAENEVIQETNNTSQVNMSYGQQYEVNEPEKSNDYEEIYGNSSVQENRNASQVNTLLYGPEDDFNDNLFEDDYEEIYGNSSVQENRNASQVNMSYEQQYEVNEPEKTNDYEVAGTEVIQETNNTSQVNMSYGQQYEVNESEKTNDYKAAENEVIQETNNTSQVNMSYGQQYEVNEPEKTNDYEVAGTEVIQETNNTSQVNTLHEYTRDMPNIHKPNALHGQTTKNINKFGHEKNLIASSFEGKNGVKIEIVRITCKNGIYTVNYDKTENNKTIRDLKKTIDINKIYLNKKYLTKEFKKKNRGGLLKLVENNEIDFNFSYFIQKEFDKKFGTKINPKYKNGELNIEYDLSNIMSWENLGISAKLYLYRIALNQERNGNAKVHHSKMVLSMLKLVDNFGQKHNNISHDEVQKNIYKTNSASEKLNVNDRTSIQDSKKITNAQERSTISKSKTNSNSNINNVLSQIDTARFHFNNQDSKTSTSNYQNDTDLTQKNNIKTAKNKNIFTRARVKIATFATVAVLIIGGGIGLRNKISSTYEKESNVASANSDKDNNELTQNTTETKNISEDKETTTQESKFCVNDVLTLVYEDDFGNVTREYPLSSAKFGEGEKYAASRCNSKLFKISSMIAYNKDTKETIDTIKDEGITANSLYGKYGSDIGINICLNACDENANITDSRELNLNYDDYTKFSDAVKQKIAESYSKDFAEEKQNIATQEKTTAAIEERAEQDNKEVKPAQISSEEEVNNQDTASYTNSNNTAHLFNKDEDGNIINACKWTSGSDGTGTSGSAELLDCDSYKFSLVVARETVDGKSIIREAVNVEKKDKSVEEIINELYKTYGDNIKIVYNFNGYKDGKLTDENLGFISKEVYDEFQNITLSEEDKFYGKVENTLAENEIFKGYKLILHI